MRYLRHESFFHVRFESIDEIEPSPRFVVDFKERKQQANLGEIFDVLFVTIRASIGDEQLNLGYLDAQERVVVRRALFHNLNVLDLQLAIVCCASITIRIIC